MAEMEVSNLSESGSYTGSDSEYEEEAIILAAQVAVLAASIVRFFISQELMIRRAVCYHESGVRDLSKKMMPLPACSEPLTISLLPNLRNCVK